MNRNQRQGDMGQSNDILFEERGVAGFITLNKQKSLNAVTDEMLTLLNRQLDIWEAADHIDRSVIKAAEGRAFSAGGDIRHLYDCGISGDFDFEFFAREYVLNARIAALTKPYIAVIDGIAMGGGVGVSFHGSHRIGGQAMQFAMPEVGIGFFPDVGGSYLLSRLPGKLGLYLGLTGSRVGQSDALWSGLITHAIDSDGLDQLLVDLASDADLNSALSNSAMILDPGPLQGQIDEITSVFSAPSVEQIVDRLKQKCAQDTPSPWVEKALTALGQKCPLSLCVAFRQINEGADLDMNACMKMEYRILRRLLPRSDFYEGIRAAIIDKDNSPQWVPNALEDVTDEMVSEFFADLGEQELDLP